jgi:hypothetical protein
VLAGAWRGDRMADWHPNGAGDFTLGYNPTSQAQAGSGRVARDTGAIEKLQFLMP